MTRTTTSHPKPWQREREGSPQGLLMPQACADFSSCRLWAEATASLALRSLTQSSLLEPSRGPEGRKCCILFGQGST